MPQPTPEPRLRVAGEQGIVVEWGDAIDPAVNARVHRLARAAAALPQVTEVIPTYRSLLVLFDPLRVTRAELIALLRPLWRAAAAGESPAPSRVVEIPVCYGGEHGPDLEQVATHCRLTAAEVVALHAGGEYLVHMLGFTPGFPYLGGLDPRLDVPRLATPRTRVPAGSVALAAGQTGVYPLESPGGWRLIGRTPLCLFDPAAADPFLLAPGDLLRFRAISPADYAQLTAAHSATHSASTHSAPARVAHASAGAVTVLKPGLLSTVQDAGRLGHRRSGMPISGAIDAFAYAVANSLAGNPAGAAALELTLAGPTLQFESDAHFALTGAPMQATLDGAAVAPWSAGFAPRGSTLAFGAAREGCRAYLAVRGGIDVPVVLGSRSTYVRGAVGGWHGRALRAGDVLPLGASDSSDSGSASDLPPRRLPDELVPAYGGAVSLRVLPGPQDDLFEPASLDALFAARWTVTPRNDRMGYRLAGPRLQRAGGKELISDALSPGAIQVPADGQPIVLAADAQTTGGYAKIGWVIGADLPLLAQARAGATLRFVRCSDAEAALALRAARERLEAIAALWRATPG